jgi:hypothetical protein
MTPRQAVVSLLEACKKSGKQFNTWEEVYLFAHMDSGLKSSAVIGKKVCVEVLQSLN